MSKNSQNNNFSIIVFRLIIPLFILIKPFWGGIFSLIADTVDVILIDLFHLKKFNNYTFTDKILDTYYLSFEFIIVLTWTSGLVKSIAIVLFLIRLVGVGTAYLFKKRELLIASPNVFELYYLYYAYFFYVSHTASFLNPVVFLILLLPIKITQEYLFHVKKIQPWENTKKYFKILIS